jgi:hypothetical protein
MKRMSVWFSLAAITLGLVLGLSACQKSNDAAQTIQSYLQARVQSDETQMINLSCADWEASARVEAASFKSMNAKLDNVTCQVASGDANNAIVACQGKIVTAYNGETRDWPLADRQFKLVLQQGEWQMCGYK